MQYICINFMFLSPYLSVAVDKELVTVELEVTESEIAVYAVIIEFELKVVKSAAANLPQMRFGKED